MEVGIDGKISFLDIMLIIEEQSLIFYVYRKVTFSVNSLISIHIRSITKKV